jgi:hypothetical protein
MISSNPYTSKLKNIHLLTNNSLILVLGIGVLLVQINDDLNWFSDLEKETIVGITMIVIVAFLIAFNLLY